jgi:hypothetical protein
VKEAKQKAKMDKDEVSARVVVAEVPAGVQGAVSEIMPEISKKKKKRVAEPVEEIDTAEPKKSRKERKAEEAAKSEKFKTDESVDTSAPSEYSNPLPENHGFVPPVAVGTPVALDTEDKGFGRKKKRNR